MDGIKSALTRKFGPLPVWAWGAVLVAAIALFLVWKRSKGGGTQAVTGGSGGTAPTDWTAVSPDPGIVPTQPVSQPSVSPGGPASGLPVGSALSGSSGGSFVTVRSSTANLAPVIPASKPSNAIKSGPLAGVVPQGPSPKSKPKGIGTGSRPGGTTPLGQTQLTPEGLSPQGAQANPHGRSRS